MKSRSTMVVEIMDTTLRDGEQTSGVSFARQEKLSIARLLLEDLKIPRIEIASARVSTGEYEMAKQLCEWAEKRGHIDKIEILGFLDKGAFYRMDSFLWSQSDEFALQRIGKTLYLPTSKNGTRTRRRYQTNY